MKLFYTNVIIKDVQHVLSCFTLCLYGSNSQDTFFHGVNHCDRYYICSSGSSGHVLVVSETIAVKGYYYTIGNRESGWCVIGMK
jgi:hypothetical protein